MKLFEIYNGLLESARTERDGLAILSNYGIVGDDANAIIKKFAVADKSDNQKNVPSMAYVYVNWDKNIDNIIEIFTAHNELEKNKWVPEFALNKRGLFIGNKNITSLKELGDYIRYQKKRHPSADDFVDTKSSGKVEKPIFENDNVKILNGDSVGKCITYTQGGLMQNDGKAYSFCIGQPGNTMYKSYRDDKASTFYFILDKTRITTNDDGTPNLDDPLHVVVFDRTKHGIELTDARNTTGNIAEFGNDSEAYVGYLRKLGVPETIKDEISGEEKQLMPNRPKSEQEKYEDELLGDSNDNLEWFMDLPFRYKSAYIGRGHRLTNDQFDYLIGR